MIEKMTRYDFILPAGAKDGFMETLGSLGVVDITRSSKPVDDYSRSLLSRVTSLKAEISRIKKASDDTLEEMKSRKDELDKEIEELGIWGDYDRSRLEATGVKMSLYSLPEKKFNPEWEDEYVLQEVARHKGKVYFAVVNPVDFPAEPLPEYEHTLGEAEKLAASLQGEIDDYTVALLARQPELPQLQEEAESLESELNFYLASISGEPAADNALLVYEGFAPSTEDARLSKAFDELPCVWLSAKATVQDNPPIKLKNNKFVKLFEVLTDMYGKPDYNEFDPTPYLSVFFLLFFAMCMGDAGYGLLLVIIGLMLRKSDGLKNLAPLVTVLGIGTFVIGIVMHTFFGVDISTLSWIPAPLKSIMITGTIGGFEAQMVLSLLIGVVHLCLAMVVKTVYATKNKGFLGSLGVWGWTLLIVGGVVVGALALFKILPQEVTKWVIIGLGILSALGIFLFNDIHRSPLKNIGSGLWETYNTVTGLLGDVLSYLRLYALGLAGGMLGKAFNDIAKMTIGDGSFGPGWILFVLILVVGHALNLAMCCLGAFMHPLRLNFLEFFKNAGYDGKGRGYQPLKN